MAASFSCVLEDEGGHEPVGAGAGAGGGGGGGALPDGLVFGQQLHVGGGGQADPLGVPGAGGQGVPEPGVGVKADGQLTAPGRGRGCAGADGRGPAGGAGGVRLHVQYRAARGGGQARVLHRGHADVGGGGGLGGDDRLGAAARGHGRGPHRHLGTVRGGEVGQLGVGVAGRVG